MLAGVAATVADVLPAGWQRTTVASHAVVITSGLNATGDVTACRLSGQNVLITGAGRGLGHHGLEVVIVHHAPERFVVVSGLPVI